MSDTSAGPSTRSVHLTEEVDPATRSVIPPVAANSAFAYPDVPSWRAAALGETDGHIYARNSNPTTDRFEAKVAALEGAERGTSFATGMAAISTTLLALLGPGKRVVTVADTYGGTHLMFSQILPRWGVDCVVVPTDDHAGLQAAIGEGCDVLYLETPTNPTLKILDIRQLSAASTQVGAVTVVDNTFATPINTRPLELGADLVLHSASKFLGGHGDVLGGVVCGSAELIARVYGLREIIGTGMDPQVAAMFLRSLKTLGLRVERQNTTAMAVAEHLVGHPEVDQRPVPGACRLRGARRGRRSDGRIRRCPELLTGQGDARRRNGLRVLEIRLPGRQSGAGRDHRRSPGDDQPCRADRC